MSKHTPGPWETSGRFVRRGIVVQTQVGKADICECYQDGEIGREAVNANARLIAAAPDLLEALREMVDMMDCGDEHGEGSPWHHRASAAIAKAEGK